ncbi:MAG TPA: tripartite tricarboxylate transporter substrate binding protein [Burkholderiales bacterium]|nr:tripartite tricarboxylate transporter substrate binding protein [Burkholderiales bacterium]
MASAVPVRGVLAAMLIVLSAPVFAQGYPSRPIRFVIPYPAGGGTDVTARPIAQKLTERWGQTVVVDSRPGASGMIGADIVAKSAPDGYTVLVSASSEMSMNVVLFKKMPYDPVHDFRPVTLVSSTPPILLAHPSLPVKSVQELVALARARPGSLVYGSIGTGTPQHFAGELMKSTLKLDIAHVPYKGASPVLIDLLGGHVPIALVAATVALPHVKAGKLRALAVTSAQRSSVMLDVPTIAETVIPGFDIVQWFAVWVPAKTPREIVDRLNEEIVRIVKSADFKQRMFEAATEAIGGTAEQLGALQKTEIDKYRRIAAAAGITPE